MPYRVMLADDEPIMRKALLTLTNWQEMECEVVYLASNGQEVIDNLENTMPDILITDIKMPGKNGIELAKYIWDNKLPVKVIILTGYADFSYAQSALKYNVVDYVIKAGVFDGLMDAVTKAKDDLRKAKDKSEEGQSRVHTENFLKSVFDGSLYGENEIREACQNVGFLLGKYGYIMAVLRFRVRGENKKRGGKTIYDSLTNFFSMVFNEKMLGAVPVERDTFALILSCGMKERSEELLYQCRQIIDMMDNFMEMYAYIGIGKRHIDVAELKAAYNEADEAMEYSFIDEKSKINFYHERNKQDEVTPANMNLLLKKLCTEISRGNVDSSKRVFEELLNHQKKQNCSAHMIKNFGIQIQNQCRTILAEYDKTIYQVTGIENSISRMIYRCRFLKDYEQILGMIVEKTTETVHIALNKKKSLIYDSKKFIEENFDKNILVTDVAKYVGASPSYLSRIFKETTGETIIATLNQKKLEKAKEYLEHTDMKIYEIAQALGFENTTYFSHFFKKYANISPKDYKRGH